MASKHRPVKQTEGTLKQLLQSKVDHAAVTVY